MLTALRRWPSMTAAAVFTVLGALTIAYTRLNGGIALVWVANGFLIPWLVLNGPRQWPRSIAACLVGSIVITGTIGLGWNALGLPLLNMVEVVATAISLHRWLKNGDFLDSAEGFGKFALIVAIVPAIAGPAAGGLAWLATGAPFQSTAFNWFAGHALGTILVAPLASLVIRRLRASHTGHVKTQWTAQVLWLSPVVIVTGIAFGQESLPLLFLPFGPMMVATLRLGRTGAAWSVIILATISTTLTVLGHGPVMLMSASDASRAQFLLFYLACAAGLPLPFAALMAQRKALIRDLRASETGYRLMTDYSGDILLHCGLDGTIRRAVGDTLALGYREDEVHGLNAVALIDPEFRPLAIEQHLRAIAQPGLTVTFEYRATAASGEGRWCETRARAVLDEQGLPTGTISAIRDVDARKKAEAELQRAATTDVLTGLLNRRAFFDRFAASVIPDGGVLIVADLDHFKSVNDRFGHHIGDIALKAYANVARAALRGGDYVARIGGEEFAFFLPGAQLDDGYALGDRLRRTLARADFDTEQGERHTVTASMGMVAVTTADDAASALKRADTALYAAKEAGRDCLRLAA